jgi:hypothetical protein
LEPWWLSYCALKKDARLMFWCLAVVARSRSLRARARYPVWQRRLSRGDPHNPDSGSAIFDILQPFLDACFQHARLVLNPNLQPVERANTSYKQAAIILVLPIRYQYNRHNSVNHMP